MASRRNFSAWIGLVPKQHSSGGRERHGCISKQGDRYLRTGALAVIRYAKIHGIRGGHYGQRSCEPHSKAEHMAAPTKPAYVKKVLANPEVRCLRRWSVQEGMALMPGSAVASMQFTELPDCKTESQFYQ